jgi:DNA helicase II / ATP-dependent DNA helicase PcrA
MENLQKKKIRIQLSCYIFEPKILLDFLEKDLAALNQAQRKAIQSHDGPVLVSAGAGTGKTSVLTLRYAYLVHQREISPYHVMAVTFTNKAAQEMKKRLQEYFNTPVQQLWVGTFHGLSLRILRQYPELISRSVGFGILDRSDQLSLLQKILKEKDAKKSQTPLLFSHVIGNWKQKGLLPNEVPPPQDMLYLHVYTEYQKRLEQMNALDFDDLLMMSYRLLRDHPDILARYQEQFKHVLVDEYQDVNTIQYLWLKLLVQGSGCIFCVGDDDQSIYGWRGANIENILRFSKDFANAEIICLEENYRSTPHILSAASHLISHNGSRYGKTLRTSQSVGEKVQVQGLWDTVEESAFIAQKILTRVQMGESFSSMAVLVRTGAQTREFEERFMLQQIPYYLVGNTKFYERQEIRDFLAYLRVVHSPYDNIAFERIINVPKRGLGHVAVQNMFAFSQEEGLSLEQGAERLCETMSPSVAQKALSHFLSMIQGWRSSQERLPVLAEKILNESGYLAMWQALGTQSEARIENLKELIKAMNPFSNLSEFLEHVSLLLEVSSGIQTDSVALMTLHAAKGLEFDTVFLPGWEENVFPHIRAIEESGKKGVEEERRLAYVGITRAKKRSFITFCWNRRAPQGWIPSSPSRFIDQLPKDHVDIALRMPRLKVGGHQGKRVEHSVFGKGSIQEENGPIFSVLFDQHGLKKVLAQFLNFEKK